MKKSTLALSVAAALGGFGFVGSAFAVTTVTGATATAISVNPRGIGHELLFPYFSAQSDNATLISITNTDTVNGKVAKVRFRGAANSDDLYDFQLLLSPGDVWTAAVSKDATTGLAKLVSTDKTCVLPATANNATFSTARTDPSATDKPNQTREGYIEVLNMADIYFPAIGTAPAAGSLASAVKHSAGVPTCNATVLDTALGNEVSAYTVSVGNIAAVGTLNNQAGARNMELPTGGLTSDWVILNQLNTAAWSGEATALIATGGTAKGNLVFWPQKFGAVANAPASVTADQLLVSGVVAMQQYDLPDLSTPYVTLDGVLAATRADATTASLAVTSLKHQFVTDSAIAAVTDVVFSQPTRRYSVGVNYLAASATDNDITVTGSTAAAVYRGLGVGAGVYKQANTSLYSRQVCLDTVNIPNVQGVFDREETSPIIGSTTFVISPNVPGAASVQLLCGETSVVSINQAGVTLPSAALNGTVARSDATFAAAYVNGWAHWDLTTADLGGLPMIGSTFMRARNGTVNYGFSFTHKTTP